jgi:hypothetical protein
VVHCQKRSQNHDKISLVVKENALEPPFYNKEKDVTFSLYPTLKVNLVYKEKLPCLVETHTGAISG